MLTTVTGIVIRERSVGEQDKFIDLLTADQGVLEVSVRGAKKITSRHGAASQLYAYGQYCLDSRRDRYYLNSAQVERIFYDLRQDLTRLSLATYFSELIGFAVGAEHAKSDILRLLLNTLHYLEEGSRPVPLLKALFELRFLTELGMMPDIVCCDVCGEYAPAQLIFRLQAGNFICAHCAGEIAPDREQMPVSGSVLQAVRPRIQAAYPGDPQPMPVQCKGVCCAPSILHPGLQQAPGCRSGTPSFPQRRMPDKSALHAVLPDSRENKPAFQVPMRPEESPGCSPRSPLLHTAVAPPPGKTQVIPPVSG